MQNDISCHLYVSSMAFLPSFITQSHCNIFGFLNSFLLLYCTILFYNSITFLPYWNVFSLFACNCTDVWNKCAKLMKDRTIILLQGKKCVNNFSLCGGEHIFLIFTFISNVTGFKDALLLYHIHRTMLWNENLHSAEQTYEC